MHANEQAEQYEVVLVESKWEAIATALCSLIIAILLCVHLRVISRETSQAQKWPLVTFLEKKWASWRLCTEVFFPKKKIFCSVVPTGEIGCEPKECVFSHQSKFNWIKISISQAERLVPIMSYLAYFYSERLNVWFRSELHQKMTFLVTLRVIFWKTPWFDCLALFLVEAIATEKSGRSYCGLNINDVCVQIF